MVNIQSICGEDKIYVNIFRADIPTEKEQNHLFDRWNTEEKEALEKFNK